ncbi:MAG: hypothetical protein N2690_06455, partial [Rhodocyclaceae bacterium]|nr:hypothetical protein [Rhodocyclaceae bacterium]
MAMDVFYATEFVLPLPAGHRFPMDKYRLLRDALARDPAYRLQQALPATAGELALVHTAAYIDAVECGTRSAAQQREIGFPWSPHLAERARRSVGATIQAARAALAGLAARARHRRPGVAGPKPLAGRTLRAVSYTHLR